MSSALTTLFAGPTRALIVGGTSGIGSAIAAHLATHLPASSRITIAGRSTSSPESTQLLALHPDKVDFKPVDAFLMSDVKRFCSDLINEPQATQPSIDILVLSQGILTTRGRTPTAPENIDQKMSLHYYSRMLIIRDLLPLLSPSALILSVLDGKRSDVHSSSIKWSDLSLAQPGNYGVSSAATHCLGMTDALFQAFAQNQNQDQKEKHQTFIHAYPGIVSTGLSNKNLPFYLKYPMAAVSSLLAVTPETCAGYMVDGSMEAHKRTGEEGVAKWVNLDDKGKLVDKRQATKEQVDKVWEHTWAVVDGQ